MGALDKEDFNVMCHHFSSYFLALFGVSPPPISQLSMPTPPQNTQLKYKITSRQCQANSVCLALAGELVLVRAVPAAAAAVAAEHPNIAVHTPSLPLPSALISGAPVAAGRRCWAFAAMWPLW